MFKSFSLLVIVYHCLQFNLVAQINCEELYEQYDTAETKTFHPIPGYDTPPYPFQGYEGFYTQVKEKTKSELQSGKIFVQFVIDTVGNVICARIIKSDNNVLNSKALKLIKDAKFVPAEQRGKKVISTIILPFIFGEEPTKKYKR